MFRPMSGKSVLTLVHLLLLLIFSWVIFYYTDGKVTIQGDDDVALSDSYVWRTVVFHDGLVFALSHRAFLSCSQQVLYNALGNSLANCELVYFGSYISSAIIWYFFLCKVFEQKSAFIAALFYLAYSGKYEIFSAFSAGMYPVVMLIGVIIFTQIELRLSLNIKAIIASLLLWLSLPFYEILIMLVPVFSILALGQCWINRKKPSVADFLFSILPVVPVITHILILSTNQTTTLWKRDSNGGDFEIPLVLKIWNTFLNSIDKTVGESHFNLLSHGVWSFFTFVTNHPNGHHGILLWLILGAVGAAVSFFLPKGLPLPQTKGAFDRNLYFLVGLYLWLFSGIIGFLLGSVFPSRMTYLPSLGLSIMIGYGIYQLFNNKFLLSRRFLGYALKGIVLLVILVWCLSEEVTLSSIIRQYETAGKYDQIITDQIVRLVPTIPPGSIVYVNMAMPENALNRFWVEGYSTYESGSAYASLWYVYHAPINGIEYINTKRWPDKPGLTFPSLIERATPVNLPHIYPFFITDQLEVKGIKSLTVLGADGRAVKTLVFPTVEGLDKDHCVSEKTNIAP